MDNDIETIESIDAMVDRILGETPKMYDKRCVKCGAAFTSKTKNAKYCPSCRIEAHREAGRKSAEKARGLKAKEPAQKQEIPQGMTRAQILDAAKAAVCGQREQDYGSPEDSFAAIAAYWTLYLIYRGSLSLTSQDVAMMMILLKVARQGGRGKLDNLIDIAGYAACGGELATGGGYGNQG